MKNQKKSRFLKELAQDILSFGLFLILALIGLILIVLGNVFIPNFELIIIVIMIILTLYVLISYLKKRWEDSSYQYDQEEYRRNFLADLKEHEKNLQADLSEDSES